jgi:exodeoxyribonuclease V alpha subunit
MSIEEKFSGVVSRVTFHNHENGWSVLKVNPFNSGTELVPVIIHQAQVFAGATCDFYGNWERHPKHGEQFKALRVEEKKPATTAALEKYIGSGLIKGVGPKTSKKIVKHFKEETLDIFENHIDRLQEVEGIARAKLETIKDAWIEHREIRKVMMFLQEHGVSTLFAVKIFKTYKDRSIEKITTDPYCLSQDFYGVGFFTADKIALSIGLPKDSPQRMMAAIKHVLASSREEGHCYLKFNQVLEGINNLISINDREQILSILDKMEVDFQLKSRTIEEEKLYYSKGLYFDEDYVAGKVKEFLSVSRDSDIERARSWVVRYCEKMNIELSEEQFEATLKMTNESFSILTGGPGCGKTTTTKTLVALLLAMGKSVQLAAPTGRAAQRMGSVIGIKAKTIHRLLIWDPQTGGFKSNEENPIESDVFIIDECSMLDISLTASLLKAIKVDSQVIFIGDPDQLPSVGAGNVLSDLIRSKVVPYFRLTKVFRQAAKSDIIKAAHKINKGGIPQIDSPLNRPTLWKGESDCFFIDSDELGVDQARFIAKAKRAIKDSKEQEVIVKDHKENLSILENGELYFSPVENMSEGDLRAPSLTIPSKYRHVNLRTIMESKSEVEDLKSVLKSVHPWSTLNYGLVATQMLNKLYSETIPKYFGKNSEIQILSPMTRGALGTWNLNKLVQEKINPHGEHISSLRLGEKVYRVGDRIIQKRNNYDLGVFNGDIGIIDSIDAIEKSMVINFTDQGETKSVIYETSSLSEIDLAYAITIHKSQGSEFDIVIIPIMTQHFKMLNRNLIYTGITRAKKCVVLLGTRKAFCLAVKTFDSAVRQTLLCELVGELEAGNRKMSSNSTRHSSVAT